MTVMAFIPARGGSVGVPNKNLREVGGISLVKRSWLHAIDCGFFDTVMLSTDNFAIANTIFRSLTEKTFINLNDGKIVELSDGHFLHKRPKHDAKTLSPIRTTLFKLAKIDTINFDLLWMLQPTSPFRNFEESKRIKLITETSSEWSSVVSMRDTGGIHPDRMYRMSQRFATPYLTQSEGDNVPRQLLEKLYVKDGAYYILKKSNLLNEIMLGDQVLPMIRSGNWTINIDTPEDLELAQKIEVIGK